VLDYQVLVLGLKYFQQNQEQKMMFNTGLTATYVDFGTAIYLMEVV
jgi:hypothetical protein